MAEEKKANETGETGNTTELKESMQMIAFMIIADVGDAKSSYMEAVGLAREGDIAGAREKMGEGRAAYAKAHKHHSELIGKEAQGTDLPFSLLFMHAEDQLLTTETIQLLSNEIIEIYSRLESKGKG